jgi:hypothetical protein
VSARAADWLLIRYLIRAVHADPCGGIHRADLAARLHVPAYGEPMRTALGVAYRHRKIDFCLQYVVPGREPPL